MSPEKQQIKIAEACGWHNIKQNPLGIGHAGTRKPGAASDLGNPLLGIPDYPGDLNAMHEAEEVLRADAGEWPLWDAYVKILGENYTGVDDIAHATARQKSAAFLRALNLWEDA